MYRHLPISLQEAALSIWALRLHRLRYGGNSRSLSEELLHHERVGLEQIRCDQLGQLRSRALLALREVPAYAGLRHRLNEVAGADSAEEILDCFPVLTKEEVRRTPEAFIPGNRDRRRLLRGMTSGTTGTPLRLYRTVEGVRRNFAFFRRVRAWRGLSHWDRTATVMGRLIVPTDQQGPPYWRHARSTRNLLLSSYHLGPQTIEACARAVARYRPKQIVCYPSSGQLIAEGLRRIGVALTNCRAVFTTAETLLPSQRALMERSFGCPVADQYGSAEWTVWISQCEQGNYHAHPEYGFLEILDSDNRRLQSGTGRAVATGFVNDAMVLMRYEVGDLITRDAGDICSCGRSLPVVRSMEGRKDDSILTPDGRWIGRLDPVFKELGGIVMAQIEQTASDLLEVRVVVSDSWSDTAEDALRQELRRRVGPAMDLRIRRVPDIPRSANGKFRAVIGWRGSQVPETERG